MYLRSTFLVCVVVTPSMWRHKIWKRLMSQSSMVEERIKYDHKFYPWKQNKLWHPYFSPLAWGGAICGCEIMARKENGSIPIPALFMIVTSRSGLGLFFCNFAKKSCGTIVTQASYVVWASCMINKMSRLVLEDLWVSSASFISM